MTHYKIPLPQDIHGRSVQGGLGNPIAISASAISATSFGTHYVAVDQSGDNAGRNYRHIHIYNPDTSRTMYVGFSSGTSAPASASIKILPQTHVVYDNILLGPNNDKTYIHVYQSASGTSSIDITYW